MGVITGLFDVSAYSGAVDVQIMSALDAMAAAFPTGGGILYIPPGSYTANNPVEALPSGVLVMGAGQGVTTLSFMPPTVDSYIFRIGQPPGPAQTSGVTIRDVGLILDPLDDETAGWGIWVQNATETRIINVSISGAQTGIRIDGSNSGDTYGACTGVYGREISIDQGTLGNAGVQVTGGIAAVADPPSPPGNQRIHLTGVSIAGSQPGAPSTYGEFGLWLENCASVFIANLNVANFDFPLALYPANVAGNGSTVSSVYIINAQAVGANSTPMIFTASSCLIGTGPETSNNIWDIKITASIIGTATGNSLTIDNPSATLTNINVCSSCVQGGGLNGVYVVSSDHVLLNALGVYNNGNGTNECGGISLYDVSDIVIGATISSNDGNGWPPSTAQWYGLYFTVEPSDIVQSFGNTLTNNHVALAPYNGTNVSASESVGVNPLGLLTTVPTISVGKHVEHLYCAPATIYITGSNGKLSFGNSLSTVVELPVLTPAGVGVRLNPGQWMTWAGSITSWQWFLD